jgi:hypothetical protein
MRRELDSDSSRPVSRASRSKSRAHGQRLLLVQDALLPRQGCRINLTDETGVPGRECSSSNGGSGNTLLRSTNILRVVQWKRLGGDTAGTTKSNGGVGIEITKGGEGDITTGDSRSGGGGSPGGRRSRQKLSSDTGAGRRIRSGFDEIRKGTTGNRALIKWKIRWEESAIP